MKKVTVIVLLIILLVTLIFLFTKKEKKFKQIELTNTSQIFNSTKYAYYDTIVSIGLSQLGINGVTISIIPLSDKAKENFLSQGGDLNAHIRESQGDYFLFIEPTSKSQSITIISHELIHLQQYHTQKLYYEYGVVYWEGQPYSLDETIYTQRPWEEEAFSKEKDLSQKISNILY